MLLTDMLKGLSQASYVEYGYGQVEPNHLSARRTGQIYAQLPAKADIQLLENGQFVKYDYAEGEVNFTGAGEWMMVFNEIKLYRDDQLDCEFAMKKDDYVARVYSPLDPATVDWSKQTRYFGGKNYDPETGAEIEIEKVTAKPDMYELHYNEDPFHFEQDTKPMLMKPGTNMVPRVFKTNVGDIYTTNTVGETELALGDELSPNANGILSKSGDGSIVFQVVKVYNMPDFQKGVKLMRIK